MNLDEHQRTQIAVGLGETVAQGFAQLSLPQEDKGHRIGKFAAMVDGAQIRGLLGATTVVDQTPAMVLAAG